jgi:membrane-associated progesterone receptor component
MSADDLSHLPLVSAAELALCDGVACAKIWIALDGKVFDVSEGAGFYGPGGNYHGFAGVDATRALALGLTARPDVLANQGDKQGLSTSQLMKIDDWLDVFESKYPVVGRFGVASAKL